MTEKNFIIIKSSESQSETIWGGKSYYNIGFEFTEGGLVFYSEVNRINISINQLSNYSLSKFIMDLKCTVKVREIQRRNKKRRKN